MIVDAVEDIPSGGGFDAACVLYDRNGEFSLQVTVCLYKPPPSDDLATVQLMVEHLGCRCLMSDDTVNPYSMILLSPGRPAIPVFVDVDALDEREEYIVDRNDSTD